MPVGAAHTPRALHETKIKIPKKLESTKKHTCDQSYKGNDVMKLLYDCTVDEINKTKRDPNRKAVRFNVAATNSVMEYFLFHVCLNSWMGKGMCVRGIRFSFFSVLHQQAEPKE